MTTDTLEDKVFFIDHTPITCRKCGTKGKWKLKVQRRGEDYVVVQCQECGEVDCGIKTYTVSEKA